MENKVKYKMKRKMKDIRIKNKVAKLLNNIVEYKDKYIKEEACIEITGVNKKGGYAHVVNLLKMLDSIYASGLKKLNGFDKNTLVKTIIFHDIGKVQPVLKIGDKVNPREVFENGCLHAKRSADLAINNYKKEGVNEDVYYLIKYHHHKEEFLPKEFPARLLPMYRMFRILDGLSAGLTRRKAKVTFEFHGSKLFICEKSQNINYNKFYSIDLYDSENLIKEYNTPLSPTLKHKLVA